MESKLESAIKLVFIAHKGQVRRNTQIEFSYHPISVGMMLLDYGCTEDIVITGLLHDLIEDTDYGYEYIKDNFSEFIANNVLSLSEDTSIKDFVERKKEFISKLKSVSDDLIIIELFDKMHNLISDYEAYKAIGKDIYNNKSAGFENNKWYYLEMFNLFKERIKDDKLLNRYESLINYYFN